MTKNYKCPHCDKINVIYENSWDEQLAEKLPENLGKAFLVTVVTVATGGIGGVLLGGYFYGKAAVKYFNGTKITCGNCGNDFYI